jgi:hypothetical protein
MKNRRNNINKKMPMIENDSNTTSIDLIMNQEQHNDNHDNNDKTNYNENKQYSNVFVVKS